MRIDQSMYDAAMGNKKDALPTFSDFSALSAKKSVPPLDLSSFTKSKPKASPPIEAAILDAEQYEGLNAQSANEVAPLAQKLGVNNAVVLGNFAEAQRLAKLNDIKKDKDVAEWGTQSPENAAMVSGEYGGLLNLSSKLDEFLSGDDGILTKSGKAIEIGNMQQELTRLGGQFMSSNSPEEQEALRQKMVALNEEIGQKSKDADFALMGGYSVLQSLAMQDETYTSQGKYALIGASAGAAIGSVLTLGVGTAIGAPVGAKIGAAVGAYAGYLVGGPVENYALHSGEMASTLAMEKDYNGAYIPQDAVYYASAIYGGLATAADTMGDAAFGALLKPLAKITGGIGKGGVRAYLKNVMSKAVKNPAIRQQITDLATVWTSGMALEGGTEALQQFASNAIEILAKDWAEGETLGKFDKPDLTDGLGESFLGGVGGGFWFGAAPAVINATSILGEVNTESKKRSARDEMAEAVKDLNGKVSFVLMESFLEAKGVGVGYVPAEALMVLYQSNPSVVEDLGLDVTYVTEKAELGHDIEISYAKALASLDTESFKTLNEISYSKPESKGIATMADFQARVHEDSARTEEAYYSYLS